MQVEMFFHSITPAHHKTWLSNADNNAHGIAHLSAFPTTDPVQRAKSLGFDAE